MPNSEDDSLSSDVDGPSILTDEPLSGQIWSAGTVVAGTYQIVRELGRGAMGVVFLAVDRVLQREIALKVIRATRLVLDFTRRFAAEARAMASVNHENVVAIHAFGVHDGLPYFVMQLVEGPMLQTWMDREPIEPRTLRALAILEDLCQGVAALHEAGIVHRDIKPSNILLDANLRASIADFGVSTTFRSDSKAPTTFAGTPAYMAPEIAFSDGRTGTATPSADVYSVACVAYQLLTGRLPVEGETELALMAQHAVADVVAPSLVRAHLSPAFDRVLLDGLAKSPKERTSSVQLFRAGLVEARRRMSDPKCIVLAEDDDDFRGALAFKLRVEFPATEVVCVKDGVAAVRAALQRPVSLAILDLKMPRLGGMAVTRALRGRAQAGDIPIVILSATGGSKDWQLLREIGADRSLVKPIDLDDLTVIIRRLLKRRRHKRNRSARARSSAPLRGGSRFG